MMIYKQPDQPVEKRVNDLLSNMSVDEKIAQLHSLWLHLSEDGNHKLRGSNFTGESEEASIKHMLQLGVGQITRPLGTAIVEPAAGVRALNYLQKQLVEDTRLGIPVIAHEEGLSGLMASGATLFPSSLAYGATWNPDLIEQVGAMIGTECLSVGCRQVLAPVLDVARDARWGRTEECFAEDPYLTGVLASRYVKGMQGENRHLLATLKHFAGHSFSEGGRNHAPVHIGWRELNDIFLLPFEMAVKLANAGSIMPAYHDIDNEPLHASSHLLSDVLRKQWDFDGIIVADYIGVSLLQTHHGVAADKTAAAVMAFGAGLDVELPGDDCAPCLKQALDQGQIGIDDIDAAVSRVLTEKFRLGLFEQPYTDDTAINLRSAQAIELVREVAEQAVVVLDNNGILPLADNMKVALIGPTANDPLAQLSDYSFPVHLIADDVHESADSVVTLLSGMQSVCGHERITFAQGCYILEQRSSGNPVFPGDVNDVLDKRSGSPLSTRLDLIEEAVAVANSADVAIVCVGDLSGLFQAGTVGEGSDADSLKLPGVQQELLDAIVATGKPVVAVLTSGRPYNLGGKESELAAQVMAFFGGEQGGMALARVLTGAAEPSGRLTLSVPINAGACPYFYNHAFKSSGTPIARHFGSRYPFGHGHSYTTFTYTDLQLESETVDCETGDIRLSFILCNTGKRAGMEIPQLYVRDKLASLVRPVKELKGFARVWLEPSETVRVDMTLPTDMLNFTGRCGHRIVEPGSFDLMIGSSSENIWLRTQVELTGKTNTLHGQWRMLSDSTMSPPDV